MSMDPVLLEIMSNKVTAIADEMRMTMQRTARSVFVNEGSDFAVGMIDVSGEVFAWPPGSKTTSINVPVAYTIGEVELEPGDVIVANDPYLTQAMATHLPDLHLIRPYYHEGRIVGYGWGFIHYMDVGGRFPGSISAANNDIFQEGLRIPPMKVVKRGELNENFVSIFRANCRLPDINMSDIHSTLGCLEVGAKRVAETIEMYGVDAFVDCQEALKEYSATRARDVFRKLPDGAYEFWDFLDDDQISRVPVRVRLCMTVKDGTLHFDLTGTDPQVEGSQNVPTAGTIHNWLTRRITTFIRTHDKSVPLNAGLFRPITATNPPGTVLNAEYPDAVGVRSVTATCFNDCVNGALLKAAPDLMAGPTAGSGGSIVLSEFDETGERAQVIIIQSLRGGMSASAGLDGVDVRDVTMNTMYNHPIEFIESKCGVRVVEYDVHPDSGGPGKWRGGCGQMITVEVMREGSIIHVRGMERFRFPAWGVLGGKPGATRRCILNRGRPDEKELGKVEHVSVAKGDTITVLMPGAAGYGDPYERDPEAVRRDVELGFVGRDAAKAEYGVVVRGEKCRLDAAVTAKTRHNRVKTNLRADFDFGPEREAWERVFDDAVMTELNRKLYALPKAVRQRKRHRIIERAVPNLPMAGLGSLADAIGDADAARARLSRAMAEEFATERSQAAQ